MKRAAQISHSVSQIPNADRLSSNHGKDVQRAKQKQCKNSHLQPVSSTPPSKLNSIKKKLIPNSDEDSVVVVENLESLIDKNGNEDDQHDGILSGQNVEDDIKMTKKSKKKAKQQRRARSESSKVKKMNDKCIYFKQTNPLYNI